MVTIARSWAQRQRPLPAALLVLWCLSAAGAAFAGEDTFICRTRGEDPAIQLIWTVTPAGLTEIRLGNRVLATGNWTFQAANWLHGKPGPAQAGLPGQRSLRVLDTQRAEVCHETPSWRCLFTYAFAGEDATITARVENCGPAPLQTVEFHGLAFHFEGEVRGYRKTRKRDILQRGMAGLTPFHPNFHNRIGGSYACDQEAGVGMAPLEPPRARTLIWWEPDGRAPHYILPVTLAPGSAQTFRLALRVSAKTDWQHLLEPYRAHFQATYGPVRYRADCRPIGMMSAVGDDRGGPGTDNPYGYLWFRFDKPGAEDRGTEYILGRVIPALATAGAQGTIIWGLSGWNHTGPNFSPDFHALPPETQAQLPALMAGFEEAKMKLGVLARPAEVVIQAPQYGRQTLIRIRADEPSQMAAMQARFAAMQRQGFSLFYLDTFGANYPDVPILMKLREGWAPEMLTFTEFWNDVTMVYSGGYTQLVWDKSRNRYRDFWWRDREWEIIRWLVPGAQLLAPEPRFEDELYHEGKPYFHDGALQPLEAVFRRRITPLFYIGDRDTVRRSEQLQTLTAVYVDGEHQFQNLDGPAVLDPIPPRRPGAQKSEAETLEDELEGEGGDEPDFIPHIPDLDESDVDLPGAEDA